jgi:hypothetical protein
VGRGTDHWKAGHRGLLPRTGFRLYWRSRAGAGGRPTITAEIRSLIRRMAEENPAWGTPKIHGELLRLGFKVSERNVARNPRRVRRRGDPSKRWLTFLNRCPRFLHSTGGDFQALVLHGRHRILHANTTLHPTAERVPQHLREPFSRRGSIVM